MYIYYIYIIYIYNIYNILSFEKKIFLEKYLKMTSV